MFGKSSQQNNGVQPAPQHPPASDLALIQGGGLVQLIVSELHPIEFALFLNEKAVPALEVESISVDIVVGDDTYTAPTVRATLSRYVKNVTGEVSQQRTELFPCTLEVIAVGRRIAITCMRPDSTDNLWVNIGLKPDGDSHEMSRLKEFRFLLTQEMLDARVTYMDGSSENLLPQ